MSDRTNLLEAIQLAAEQFAAETSAGDLTRAEAWAEIGFGMAGLLPDQEEARHA